ncbi:(E2-independent) E3 ubiquitin-conjugating enzyme FATS [Periophthalmus magnuspinnatus]|uniref:(E2-independent) E3 ubiquitin-conjugating enzyme FATS n=1 Tax=Periophthalmus magnuspinnatus TaxID=409849 RepID=UPI002436908B|nr:(E2-independent) E3 ubiquitin-conjugating enzyme FATS [Periophthalmus magnuspinnatus]
MSLHGPSAPLCKTWTRSPDESYWESLSRDHSAPRPERRPRPQSAIEGGQLDGWIKHLQRIQPTSNQDQAGEFQDTSRDKERSYPTWRAKGSSSGGSLSGSSFGSQESVQSGILSPPERRDSWEKARISQTPKKEQSRVSFLTPVKIGWLPIRRKVMMVGEQGRSPDAPGQQVKLKPPITPTLVTHAPPPVQTCSDEELQRSQSQARSGATQQQKYNSAIDKQEPEKRIPAVTVGDASIISWQALKRSWRLNRALALPGSSPSNKNQTRINLDPPEPKTFTQSPSAHREKPESLRTAFVDPSKDTATYKTPLHRSSSTQPLKASHIQTNSTAKTFIPENKTGFSSITISSRKVCRSSSLPPTPSPSQESMDANSRHIMVQRKATIVKVTEHRVTTSPIRNVKPDLNQLTSQKLDTVVHRRKATIIKVTEHRERFSPTNVTRNNEYRHSYTEGFYNDNRVWMQGNQAIPNPTPIDSKPIHKSTLNLIVTSTPPPSVLSPPTKSEFTNATSQRPQRPSSCYGNVFGKSEDVEEKLQPLTRKLSFDSTERNGFGNRNRGLNVPNTNGVKISGKSDNGEGEMVVPPLTLIKAPDADQTPEDVLALNAAAIIANIKLQRQCSQKRTSNRQSDTHPAPSPQDDAETAIQDSAKDDNGTTQSHAAAFVPLSNDIQRSTQDMSLQEALLRSRPDFINRSKRRTQELERRVKERRTGQERKSGTPEKRRGVNAHSAQHQNNSCPGTIVKDEPLKSSRVVTKTQQRPLEVKRSQREEVKRRHEEQQEEDARRDAILNNRLRADLFKKKLLDQVLQRSKD